MEAACESLSPCSVHTSPTHPTPHGLPHAWAPRAPIPVLQDPGWGCGGRKGPLHLHPLPCPKPVRGLWDGGAAEEMLRQKEPGRAVHLLFHRPVTSRHPRRPPAGRPLSPLSTQPGLLQSRNGPPGRDSWWPLSAAPISRPGLASEKTSVAHKKFPRANPWRDGRYFQRKMLATGHQFWLQGAAEVS